MTVFISYAKADKENVAKLDKIVRHSGRRSWQFVYDLHGARDWAAQIQYGIDRCEAFLFVITEYSLQSKWCLKELQHAALSQKPIVTVVLKSDIDIPYPLNTIQYVLFDETPESGAKLTRALQDPHPISRDKIPSHWETLGGGPYDTQRDISIPHLQRELTDLEKEDFLNQAILEIRSYFVDALHRFESVESRVTTRLKDHSNSDFRCEVYVDGNLCKSCRIRVNNDMGLSGIAYSAAIGNMARYNSDGINALAQVSVLNGHPVLEFVFDFMTSSGSRICTVAEASERLWKAYTEDLAQDNLRW